MPKRTRLKNGHGTSKKLRLPVHYVQFIDRGSDGVTIIGQPVRTSIAKTIRKELFGDNPNVVMLPSVPPKKKGR